MLEFELTVRLPKLANNTALRIPHLETSLSQFDHQLDHLQDSVYFDRLDLQSANGFVAAMASCSWQQTSDKS